MRTKDEMIHFHNESQTLIDTSGFKSKEGCVLHLIHTFAYKQAANLAKDMRVLDLGCNVGYGSEILSRSAKTVTGVDVSANAIQYARVRYEGSGMTFLQIDGKTLPFGDAEFDLVVSCQVIEHIVDYDGYIGEILRVLAPDGFVLFTTPNARIRLDPGMKPWYEFHVKEFDSFELESLLRKYFSRARAYGLFAEEPIHSIELQRVTAIRDNARARGKPIGLKQVIKNLLPARVVKMLAHIKGNLVARDAESDANQMGDGFADLLSSKELFYQQAQIDSSLDLLAVCSNAIGRIEELDGILTKRERSCL